MVMQRWPPKFSQKNFNDREEIPNERQKISRKEEKNEGKKEEERKWKS